MKCELLMCHVIHTLKKLIFENRNRKGLSKIRKGKVAHLACQATVTSGNKRAKSTC
jgi:hypothetical protein